MNFYSLFTLYIVILFVSTGTSASSVGLNPIKCRVSSLFDKYLKFNNQLVKSNNFVPFAREEQAILVTCMDVRLMPEAALGLPPGKVNVLRNAGGRVGSLLPDILLSQQILNTTEITILHHTDCGMHTKEATIKSKLLSKLGPESKGTLDVMRFNAFKDLQTSLTEDYDILMNHPLIKKNKIRTGIWDVRTNMITEVKQVGQV